VIVGNVYGYAPPSGPVREDEPIAPATVKGRVRAAMWEEALAAQEAGRVRVSEVRGSDYVGAGAISVFSWVAAPQIISGAPALMPADLDAPHTWTATDDVAAALAAVSRSETAWGRAWHVPSNPPLSIRELAARFARFAGIESYTLEAMTPEALAQAAEVDTLMAELPEMQYLFQRPFVLDSAETEATFGLAPSSLDDAIRAMATAMSASAQPA
jgi:nucleoside-diphosphate-sugar epimerase